MGWHVVDGSKTEWGERDPLFEGQPPRQYVEVTDEAQLKNSRARVWRYPPGTRGRRHADKVQEEVFVVISGRLTMQLGDPPERVDVGAPGLVAVEPGRRQPNERRPTLERASSARARFPRSGVRDQRSERKLRPLVFPKRRRASRSCS